MKVLLAIMRVDRFASCENIVPRLQTSSILLPPPSPSSLPGLVTINIPLKKLFYSQW